MAPTVMRSLKRLLPAILLVLVGPLRAQETTTLKVEHYQIRSPEYATTRSFNGFQREHPSVRLLPFTSLRLEGSAAAGIESTKLLCFASHIGPDVLTIPPGNLHHYRQNGFLMDLSGLIGRDTDGDGSISDRETSFEPWKSIPPMFRDAVMIDGRPFALPVHERLSALLIRRDLLEPLLERGRVRRVPRTWDELHYLCQKATVRGVVGSRWSRRGIHLDVRGRFWDALVWSAGGQLMQRPGGSPDPTAWRATFASPEGIAATAFYWKLVWGPWIRDPLVDPDTADHEPINLSAQDVQRGSVRLPGGRLVEFEPADVYWGVARGTSAGDDVDSRRALADGDVVFAFSLPAYMFRQAFLAAGIGAHQLGFCPVPAPDEKSGRAVVIAHRQFWGLNRDLADAPTRQAAAFELLAWLQAQLPRNATRQSVEEGHGAIVAPARLREAGFAEYVDEVPPHLIDAYEQAAHLKRAGPFAPSWEAIRGELISGVLTRLVASKQFDHGAGLRAAQERANRTVIPGATAATGTDRVRLVIGVFLVASFLLLGVGVLAIRSAYAPGTATQPGRAVGSSRGVASRTAPWLMLFPALGLIALWAYYPMLKGSIMSFQDYSIAGTSRWVGLANFLGVLVDPRFYKYVFVTCKFTFWSLLMGFTTPIVLALLLDEVPRFKFTFRMIFLLPNVCAGLVVIFLWKMMFHPTGEGFLNSILMRSKLIDEPLRFYQDPDMALLCCILPGVWASVGIGALIYLAALKSVPTELYEAAEVDGAAIRHRLRHITAPIIKPLIIIQFIGAFIGTFHTMGNIFVMTGGGPDGQTTVLALKIWKDAFVYLNFGLATATAWVLGTALIGFTIWQLRFLKKVEFRRAEAG